MSNRVFGWPSSLAANARDIVVTRISLSSLRPAALVLDSHWATAITTLDYVSEEVGILPGFPSFALGGLLTLLLNRIPQIILNDFWEVTVDWVAFRFAMFAAARVRLIYAD